MATFASAAIWPHAGASQSGLVQSGLVQSGLVEGYADGDGVRLNFVQGGEGQLILFLHGVPDSWTLYMSQLAEFSQDHMVVAPNLRGFPPSEVRNSASQIQASQYERDYCTAIAPCPSWYNYYRADPIKVPSSISDAAHTEMPDLAAIFFADVAEPPATTSLRVDVPTLVLWGMKDPHCLPSQLDNLHDYAPNAIVVRIEDGGHVPMQSHPMLVNRAIRDFLRREHHKKW